MLDQKFSILFWINKSKINANGQAPIWVRITIDGKRAECSTSKHIKPEHWDSELGLPDSKYYLANSLKQYLRQVEVEINRHYNILISTTEYVTAENVKKSYKGVKENYITFLELFDQFNKHIKERVEKGDLSESRYKRFLILRGKCASFIKEKLKRADVLLKDLKLAFIESLYHYMTSNDLDQNTAMDYCKKLKQVLTYAAKFEYVTVSPFHYFRLKYKKTKRTFIDEEELQVIYSKQMPVKRLEEVRDCYLFCCYTGYAYGDARDLTPNDIAKGIDGNLWIIRNRLKTDVVENVPLLPIPLEILEKYKDHPYCVANNKLLPMSSKQCYNAYLKEIAAICDIDKNLTSHTARHTFATTVTLCNDVPIETVKELLGHEDIRTTQIYAKIVDTKISKDMNKLSKKLRKKNAPKTFLKQAGEYFSPIK
jgi:integrase